MIPLVFVDRIEPDLASFKMQVVRACKDLSIADDFTNSTAIFIKPNLTYPVYKEGVTTRKEFVEGIVAALRKINETTKIYIGEGDGGCSSFSMTEAMRSMGFFELESAYPNVKVVNLSELPTRRVELKANGRPYGLYLPEIFFSEIDFSITCPLPKVHCMTKVTLAFKNQWGCLPDIMRLKNHYVLDEIIGQVCDVLKFRYAFLDGKFGLDDNGPMDGTPVEVNWFAASNSLGAFDVVVSEMMGIDWQTVGHLKMAAKNGYIPKKEDIRIIGEVESLKRKFTLKRGFWHYPALAAFQSKNLTHLFYFSRWAKPLHDIMYSFREKPVS